MDNEVPQSDTPSIWAPLAIFAGTATSTAWIAPLLGGSHDSLQSPNATSIGLKSTDDLLYIVQPLPTALEMMLGIVGLLLLMAGIAYLLKGRNLRANQRVAIGVGVLAGAVLGLSWWAMTFGTVDANIGGGMAVMLGLPSSLVMIALAIFASKAEEPQAKPNPKSPSSKPDRHKRLNRPQVPKR